VIFIPPLVLADFRVRFPEFDAAGNAYVQAYLDLAANNVDPAIYGVRAVDAAYYYAADALAMSPFGQQARLVSANGTTTYRVHFERMMLAACSGARLT
jgi:hypothetical protein